MDMKWVSELIRKGREKDFYRTWVWKVKRREILVLDKSECQYCKAEGFYTKATMVHHVKPLHLFPELALSNEYTDAEGKKHRQLISLCKDCHETKAHPKEESVTLLTPERW
jgi:5-methylcytosine-specific restriction endonuclease McrA